MKKFLNNYGEIKFKLQNISLFKYFEDYDTIKIDVASEDLEKLHYTIEDNFENKNKFKDYKPHITIAYVEKNSCDNLNKNKEFYNVGFIARSIIYSSSNDKKYKIKLI